MAQLVRPLGKVLIANRGEVAVRVARAAREAGVRSAAVFAEDDANAAHRWAADEAHLITPSPGFGLGPYLDIDAIVALARRVHADAVHPGYGFLSENADFARACAKAGLRFVGPSAPVLGLFGDKLQARALASQLSVPVTPGSRGASYATVEAFVREHGLPVMLKATKGGGGRGMRVVHAENELRSAYDRCASEAETAFGDAAVFVEAYVDRARHVEVQVLGDAAGRVMALGDRDCSVQKVVEVAPCLALPDDLRMQLTRDALRLCARAGLQNAATVEFLVPSDRRRGPGYFFLEVNPRIQVEHTITEEVTGVDLVAAQLQIAAGATFADLGPAFARLALTQPTCDGGANEPAVHWPMRPLPIPAAVAIQLRVVMEAPGAGAILDYAPCAGPGVRVESALYTGYELPFAYDPLLCKIVVRAGSFAEARTRAERALHELRLRGPVTNHATLARILAAPEFAAHTFTTALLQHWTDTAPTTAAATGPAPAPDHAVAEALLRGDATALHGLGVRTAAWAGQSAASTDAGALKALVARAIAAQISGTAAAEPLVLTTATHPLHVHVLGWNRARRLATVALNGALVLVPTLPTFDLAAASASTAARTAPGTPDADANAAYKTVEAPSAAILKAVLVAEGAEVAVGTPVLVLSIMKMDVTVPSPFAGRLHRVHVKPGAAVRRGETLLSIDPVVASAVAAPRAPAAVADSAATAAAALAAYQRRMTVIRDQLAPPWRSATSSTSAPASSADWSGAMAEIDQLQRQMDWAGHEEGILRQHRFGKLTVRERIALLVDPGSWREVGSLAGKMVLEPSPLGGNKLVGVVPANFVGGRATIAQRPVMVGGDDFTIRGGHADGALARKQLHIEQLTRELRVPMVRLLDGSSGGGSVATYLELQATYVPPLMGVNHLVHMLNEVPVAAALLGPVVGFAAARATLTHFSTMVRSHGQLFVAGPPVVHQATGDRSVTKESLGGAQIHGTNGAVDNIAESEEDALRQIHRFLSYLPTSAWALPPRLAPAANDPPTRRDEALIAAVPRERRRPFDMRAVVGMVVDRDSFFEIGTGWGRSQIVGFARLNGYAIGILANDPLEDGGTMTALSAQKLRRHVDLCAAFHVPILSFVDQPGFAVGIQAETEATIRHGAAAMAALYQATVPWFTVIVRRAFGVAGAAMVDRADPNVRVAWPSGDWGSLPLEGGVEAAFKGRLARADDPEKLKAELLNLFEEVRAPARSAHLFSIEEIIDPRDTRPLACEWADLAYAKLSGMALGPRSSSLGFRP